ncbi:GNAT family N-acetyltransferase [Luteimonas sp. BDR2-5]|uniref:GNAT family N-acetyltransferase n=1 Tax=Proluteimonas luteida TaxID=2878685 RepID=UPI001E5F689C|nr:GNAT family N-acetyltransferase [Luteimonas sp. BDR2-5]MCD9026789.1 GNAT family N-acetyltransferase [Luteimonas sp. BDR2-5]
MIETNITAGTPAQAETVVRWLKKEWAGDPDAGGFYHNRSIIRQAARSGEMTCLYASRTIVGFSVFTLGQSRAKIDIFEIRPGYRGRGFGRYLAAHILRMLLSHGAARIEVECAPRSSEPFWRKLGFVDHEERPSGWGNPKLVLASQAA